MGSFYRERVCNLGSERGDSSGSSEGKQKPKGQLVCHEHPGGGLKPRPGDHDCYDCGGFISLVSFSICVLVIFFLFHG